MTPPRTVPEQITKQLKNWWCFFWFWNVLHYVLGLYATVGTVFIAASKQAPDTFLSITVAVSTAALTFLKATEKASAYIAAWRYLNSERICFELDPNYPETNLCKAHKKGEEIIGKSDESN